MSSPEVLKPGSTQRSATITNKKSSGPIRRGLQLATHENTLLPIYWSKRLLGLCHDRAHAGYFRDFLPIISKMTDQEIAEDYEANTDPAVFRNPQPTNPGATPGVLEPVVSSLHEKHYSRKHGKDAYYRQIKDEP
jgi:hypothetical protein